MGLLRSAITEGKKNTVRSQIVVNKSPSTLIKGPQSSGESIAVTDSPKTTVEIGHSSNLSIKVAESPSTSIFDSDCSHDKLGSSDLELLICDDPSVAPLNVSEPTAIVNGECVNTHQSVDATSSTKSCTAAADDVQLIGSQCK